MRLAVPLLAAWLTSAALGAQAQTQDVTQETTVRAIPSQITFMVSGGYWTGAGNAKGYYRLESVRQPDHSARVFLQEVEVAANGAATVTGTAEITALSKLHALVTDIRPQDPAGVITGPGFFATVYVRTVGSGARLQKWTVAIDNAGELRVGPARN